MFRKLRRVLRRHKPGKPPLRLSTNPIFLVDEILREILAFVDVPYETHRGSRTRKDLASCLLVCRRWHKFVAALLWREPFDQHTGHGADIIATYLACLSDAERDLLTRKGVDLSGIPAAASTSDYILFLKHLDLAEMLDAVVQWCEQTQDVSADKVYEMTAMILRHRARNPTGLNGLRLCPYAKLAVGDPNDLLRILTASEAPALLAPVRRLELGGACVRQKVVNALAGLCRDLTYLSVDAGAAVPGTRSKEYALHAVTSVADLIRAQRHLSQFCMFHCKASAGDVMSALESQRKSLRSLQLFNVSFESCKPWRGLARCARLQALSIISWSDVTLKMVKPLLAANLMELRSVLTSGLCPDEEVDRALREWSKLIAKRRISRQSVNRSKVSMASERSFLSLT